MNDGSLYTTPVDRTPVMVQLDNLIRRQLRVSDPANATEVASGLRRLYARDARALEQEASGLPIATGAMATRPVVAASPSAAEIEQARADVERDLRFLTTSAQLKDIDAELEGWGQALRVQIADGLAASYQALDPRARDRTMAARRVLGDYARAARLVGAMTPGFSLPYRRLAQSLDQVAALLLVFMGEGMAQLGQGGGRFLLAAPASELIIRRDAALSALRNLLGSTQTSLDQGTWPWGLRGFAGVLRALGESAQADVRALFEENTLARLMDELIERASSSGALGMRGLAATGQLAVQRLERLVAVAAGINSKPGSPPLAAFLEAVQLFVDGFRGGGASRMLAIARPPIVSYGLYDFGGINDPTRRLQEIIVRRGELARLLDCYMGCDCCGDEIVCQAVLDKLLYDVDRAIDFYALGTTALGSVPEIRAAAFGLLIRQFLSQPALPTETRTEINCVSNCLVPWANVSRVLGAIRDELLVPLPTAGNPPVVSLPLTDPAMFRPIREELCLQRSADKNWEQLLATLTPGCANLGTILSALAGLVDRTLAEVDGGGACPPVEILVPPTLEELLDTSDGEIDAVFPPG